jgi:D-alanyl-D-alanine carboxypeptidase/D-alanyl-D-alanine-endopeptidase (penicillin-binding protein 4)
MKRFCMRRAALLTAFTLVLAAAPARAQLPAPVTQALRAAALPDDALSALVLRGDATVLAHLADRPMHPGSTIKLVTTLVALETLGPAFRGRTELRTTAPQRGDVLAGDLVLRGGADIDLSTETLTGMLRALRYQGIRRIEGRLVVDRGLFNPARPDLGVTPFDEYPDAYYNVIPDALLVNRNMLQLDMRSTNGDVRVAMQPDLQDVRVASAMKLTDTDCARWEDGWKPGVQTRPDGSVQVLLGGTFPKNCVVSYGINILDRQQYLDRLLRRIWRDLGGSIAGATVEAATPPGTRLLAEHVSRPLPELVRDTNKPSDNALARTLFLSLGALQADPVLGSRPLDAGQAANPAPATTTARAEAVVRTWLRAHGIADTGLVLENGSGLSRIVRITPVQMAGVLQAGLRSDWAPEFLSSLPIAGVDGTLRRRLQDSPAAGHARMKTGTLNGVNAVAGYVPDANGRPCIVVAMVNGDAAGNARARAVLDALVDWVARSGGGNPAADAR